MPLIQAAKTALYTLGILALSGSASAQPRAEPAIPVEETSYHIPAFKNDLVLVFWEEIPPGRSSGYHVHTNDMTCVVITDYPPEAYSQNLGQPPRPPRRPKRGEASYVEYFGKTPLPHNAINAGKTSMHSICAQLISPKPYGHEASVRIAPGYTQVIDNARVRAWRLILEPGESVPAITQTAPGLRIIIRGGEIAEVVPGRADRGMYLPEDHFYWQDAKSTRAVRNIGKTPVEMVEFEFK